jgi:DNA-binding SARP family transcriptional activator
VEVGVLGPVEVRVGGRLVRLGRAKSVELLVHLSMHRDGVAAEQLWEVLWPERPLSRALLHTTVSVARLPLRPFADGRPTITDARGSRGYRLGLDARLDWAQFGDLVARAWRLGSDGGALLAEAMALVRGTPFSGTEPGSYEWAMGERTEMEAAIGAAAERLANIRLDEGDAGGARAAARQGLRGAPYDQRLYRALMLAAHTSGHTSGVDAVVRELAGVFGGPDAIDGPTQRLYERLRRVSYPSSQESRA